MSDQEHYAKQAAHVQAIQQNNARGAMTDIADDYALFMHEIEMSMHLTPAAIGYIGRVMHEVRQKMNHLLTPGEDADLGEMVVPAVIGSEEGCMCPACSNSSEPNKMVELLDLGLIASLASVRAVVLARIRKTCGTADMLDGIVPGRHGAPSAEFVNGIISSTNRIFRLLDAIGISFTGPGMERFDLQEADRKFRKYVEACNSAKPSK